MRRFPAELIVVSMICMVLLSIPVMADSQSIPFQVTSPTLPGSVKVVPSAFGPLVLVNVTSPNPILNVTLYFRGVSSPPPQDLNDLSLYNKTIMTYGPIKGNNYTFKFVMPRFPNQTEVWGLAKAFDTKGNVAISSSGPSYMYFVHTPRPDAWVALYLSLWDVNPRFLNITGYMSVTLYNSATFEPITLQDSTGNLTYVRHQYAEAYWDASHKFVLNGYNGLPQLFPFDNYTYTYDANLMYSPKLSHVSVNGHTINATGAVAGIIEFSPRNLGQVADESAWVLTSTVRYLPNQTANSSPHIVITVHLERQPEQVNYLILIPILALYAFLGASVLLQNEGDITNRLFVYLSIFLFVYAFLSFIKSLPITPFILGFSMAERFGIALVPCTVILAITSIIRWIAKSRIFGIGIDLIGVFLALDSLWLVVQFPFTKYVLVGTSYALERAIFDIPHLGSFGWLVVLALASGAICLLVWIGWISIIRRVIQRLNVLISHRGELGIDHADIASRRRDLLQVLIILGGLIGTFATVFKPSSAVATVFSTFIMTSVVMYALILFEMNATRFGRLLYLAISLVVSFSFGAIAAILVTQAVSEAGAYGLTTIYLVYLALGTFLVVVFNFRGRRI